MTKRTAVIVVASFCAIIIILSTYIYQQTRPLTDEDFSQLVDAYNNNDTQGIIRDLKGRAQTSDERLLLAGAYLQEGSLTFREEEAFNSAKPLIEEVLIEDPNSSEAMRLMGYGFEITEDYDNALRFYDDAIKADITNSIAISNKAHAQALMGLIDEAIRDYQRAIAITPDLDHAALGLARLYNKKDINSKESMDLLDIVINKSINKRLIAEANQIKALMLMEVGKYDDAQIAIDSAIENDQNFAHAYVTRAELYFTKTDQENQNDELFESIFRDIEKATSINPNLTIAYHTAAVIARYNGYDDVANNLFTKALAVIPNDISLSTDEKSAFVEIIKQELEK